MASPVILPFEDKDLDDADLWAVIDSAAASYSTAITTTTTTHSALSGSRSRKPLALKPSNCRTPQILHPSSPSPPQQLQKSSKIPRYHHYHSSPNNVVTPYYGGGRGEVLDSFDRDHQHTHKISRSSCRISEVTERSPSAVVRHAQASSPAYSSPGSGRFTGKVVMSPFSESLVPIDCVSGEDKEIARQIALGGRANTVNLFKEYQDTAMAILEKSDYMMISGNPYIKKSGWRKLAFYFNVSFEIKDKSIEFDDKRNIQRAEFLVRAHMPSGRFSDGWGSCERNEKRFMKPNNDIPSTAETRAKNKACQDLLGIGQYRPGATCKP